MNLKQMLEKVANKTDHDPEEIAYRNQIALLLNEAYQWVWGEAIWPFAQKLSYLDMLPDLTPERLAGQTVTTNDGQRDVVFSANVEILTARQGMVVGNILELYGRDYTVLQVNSATGLVLTEPVRHPVVAGVSPDTLAGQPWKLKFRYYLLPEDCLEILNIAHRDAPIPGATTGMDSKIWSVANRPEESLGLREDLTADYARAYFPIPPHIVPPAEQLTIDWIQNEEAEDGTFPGDEWWEFCWCLVSPDGVHGPLSEPLRTLIPAAIGGADFNAVVNFKSFDGQEFKARAPSYSTRGAPEPLEGLRKVLFFNANMDHTDGSRLGERKWLQVLQGTPVPTPTSEQANLPLSALDVESSVELRFRDGCVPGCPPYVEFDGQHRRIRPWPRVDAWDQEYSDAAHTPGTNWRERREDFFRRAELRYAVKPQPLRYDTDTPSMPFQFHQMIVDKALWDIFLKSNDKGLAKLYGDRYDKQLKKVKARMFKTDTQWRMGQGFGSGMGLGWSSDYTLTFEG